MIPNPMKPEEVKNAHVDEKRIIPVVNEGQVA